MVLELCAGDGWYLYCCTSPKVVNLVYSAYYVLSICVSSELNKKQRPNQRYNIIYTK